ncbi:unnamed protein product, partial [Brassica oleracea]
FACDWAFSGYGGDDDATLIQSLSLETVSASFEFGFVMAPRQVPKSRKAGSSSKLKAANSSPASSTASSPILYQETSVDSHSSPTSSSVRSKPQYTGRVPQTASQSKENVTVTVRFRPLSPREIRRGEEIAWYADGETIVRNEHTPTIAYAYDRVFGPTTTTRQVYDVSAQHVVNGAMEGTNGTIFAYGVTSSGKTHTMHGDQRSPGIIPLAVKDAFDIIQETPRREFLLRVSYLEIYNEVVNDLLNPVGQNLRIREDEQGAFIEGIKEEVVLSPAHALSLIAAGEEHRHIGSTSFNLLSSRSHTMFTLTIESSPLGGNNEGEAVHLSQLNLIDLAGSESSKAATSGLRRKEGSYINKSLLTLGTVISKLTDRKASHVPFRDSKLTRLLQSSLSGHGRVSLICTVTPASSCTEETHNTLKFAHRAKHIEIQAAQNKIIDEKSLIKKYQNEIRQLKEELEELKQGIKPVSRLKDISEDNIVLLKQKLEEEEDAKAALLSRIQRLTKLILVSAKTPQTSRVSHRVVPRRRHSFGQEELAYLPYKRRDLMDEENLELYVSGEANPEIIENDAFREEKKTRKHGLLNWLKLKKRDNSLGESSISDKSSAVKSNSTRSTPQGEGSNFHTESKLSESSPLEPGEDVESLEDSSHEIETPEARRRTIDQMDILREQQKILSEEMALQSKSFKQLSEEATKAPENEEIKAEIINLNDDIKAKNDQIAELGKQILDFVMASHDALDKSDIVQAVSEMRAQLNEKSFELEVKAADNRIVQEQLNQKTCECEALQEEVANLKQQLSDALELGEDMRSITSHMQQNEEKVIQAQAFEIEELKLKAAELSELKEELELRNQKLAEESSYAKELASTAAVELRALSEEVASLMNRNERLAADLAAAHKSSVTPRGKTGNPRNGRKESPLVKRKEQQDGSLMELKRELSVIKEREVSFEAALVEKVQREAELQRTIAESKEREAYLENELANMWVLVAKLRRSQGDSSDISVSETRQQTGHFGT